MRRDIGLLFLRIAFGGLLAGHGAQKLFGWFGGHGVRGTAGWLDSMGMRKSRQWAIAAGAAELGAGVLTAAGAMYPLAPLSMVAPMATAIRTVHWGKPIWTTEGGAELPLAYATAGLALACTGPGRYSFDEAAHLRLPRAVVALGATAMMAATAMALRARAAPRATLGDTDIEAAQPIEPAVQPI